jgi:hypothetical protein
MMKGDWDTGGGILFDQCKECGENEEVSPEGTMPVRDEENILNV